MRLIAIRCTSFQSKNSYQKWEVYYPDTDVVICNVLITEYGRLCLEFEETEAANLSIELFDRIYTLITDTVSPILIPAVNTQQ